jgi:hypothetical protein
MKELLIKLSLADKETLGSVRTISGLQVAMDGEWIWLRVKEAKENTSLALRQLPAIHSYEMDEQEKLFPAGGLTPVGRLKKLSWIPVKQFIEVKLPTSAIPGNLTQRYAVSMVTSTRLQEGQALITTLSLWKEYAHAAPEVRLGRLRFALSAHNEVLIMGSPLPAIPGKEYWMQEGMLLPAGFDFDIPWLAPLIAGKLNPLKDSIIKFNEDSSWAKIPKDAFMPATRSAVRLTEENK